MQDFRLETPRSARIVTVIETQATRGAGTDGDPVRIVTQYWQAEGESKLLAEHDPELA